MSGSILKFKLGYPTMDARVSVKMPRDARILHIDTIDESIYIWALTDFVAPLSIDDYVERTFAILPTGEIVSLIGASEKNYVGTVKIHHGRLVFHVFETSTQIPQFGASS